MKKILILYTSVGLGHKYLAENIAHHLRQDGHEILLHDILKVQQGLMVDVGVWLHSFLNRHWPFIWRWLYFSSLVNLIGLPLRIPLAKSNSEQLYKVVKTFSPDAIITTQTTASAAAAALILQKKFRGRLIIAFSDYHLHRFWLYDQADLYLANIEEQKQAMVSLGVPLEKIEVCGITLKPKPSVGVDQLRERLQLASDDRVVIFASGSLGIGFDFELLENYGRELISENSKVALVVLCGKNQQLKDRVDALKLNKIRALGFYQNPQELYQLADVLVTKPGGLTIAEALQAGVKILITHTLPGQEEPNYDYLLKENLVQPIPVPLNARTLCEATVKLLNAPDHSRETNSETTKTIQITQLGNEGKVLKHAVNSLFHS